MNLLWKYMEKQAILFTQTEFRKNNLGREKKKSYRIIKCFGLEGTFRGHLAQLPCSKQGHLQLDQVAQSPIQPGLECFQGWGLHYLSGQPVTVFHHPYRKHFFLISSLNVPSLSLKPLFLVLLQQTLLKIFSPSFLEAPFRY